MASWARRASPPSLTTSQGILAKPTLAGLDGLVDGRDLGGAVVAALGGGGEQLVLDHGRAGW